MTEPLLPDDDDTIIICFEPSPYIEFVEGSVEDKCAGCGRTVMVAPTSYAFIAANPDKDVKLTCLECALPKMIAHPETSVESVPGVAEALDAKFGAGMAEKANERFGKWMRRLAGLVLGGQ